MLLLVTTKKKWPQSTPPRPTKKKTRRTKIKFTLVPGSDWILYNHSDERSVGKRCSDIPQTKKVFTGTVVTADNLKPFRIFWRDMS